MIAKRGQLFLEYESYELTKVAKIGRKALKYWETLNNIHVLRFLKKFVLDAVEQKANYSKLAYG